MHVLCYLVNIKGLKSHFADFIGHKNRAKRIMDALIETQMKTI